MAKYYLDSCIWVDYLEDRTGTHGRPLGSYAGKLFLKIMQDRDMILFSDVTIEELKDALGEESASNMLGIILLISDMRKVEITPKEVEEAVLLAKQRNIPRHKNPPTSAYPNPKGWGLTGTCL